MLVSARPAVPTERLTAFWRAGTIVVVDDFNPARHGSAYGVKKGHVLRIYLLEDHKVGDVTIT